MSRSHKNSRYGGFGRDSGGCDFAQVVVAEGAGAAAFHLLEIIAAFDIAHEEEAFERFHVGTGGHHIHGDGDAGVIIVAELGEDRLGIFVGFVSDLFAEGVSLGEFLADDIDDVVGVAIGLGEDEGLGDFGAAGKDFRELVAEGFDDGADLVRNDNGVVELLGGIGRVFIGLLPAAAAGQLFALLDELFGDKARAVGSDFGFDCVNFVADVDAIGNGSFVAVVADDVVLEEAEGAVIGRGRKADEKGVEVIEHLLPDVVNGAVTLVYDDEIKELGRNFVIVNHRHGFLRFGELFGGADFFEGFVERLVFEDGILALDGADAGLTIGGDVGGLEPMDGVKLGELAVVVAGGEGHELLLGLFAQVPGIHEEEDAFGFGVLEQAIDFRDGGEGFAGAGGHLDEGARAILFERTFEVGDGA